MMTDLETVYLSFVHISDLHFESSNPSSYFDFINRLAANFPGLYGEDWTRATALAFAFDDARQERNSPKLLVSGDLTAWGVKPQLDRAIAFIQDEATALGGNDARHDSAYGLYAEDWRRWSVPGNHDHWVSPFQLVWPGMSPNDYCRDHFEPMPRAILLPLGDDHALRLCFLDSDSEVWGADGQVRKDLGRRAQGRFVGQLDGFDAISPTDPDGLLERVAAENIATVMVVHHSPSYSGAMCGIDWDTKEKLKETLARRSDVRLILSGHIHETYLGPMFGGFECQEARCGTTTQRFADAGDRTISDDQRHITRNMRRVLGAIRRVRRRGGRRNAFLVHTIGPDGNRDICWNVETWHYAYDKFERCADEDAQMSLRLFPAPPEVS